MSQSSSSPISKWLAGIAATVIGAVLIWLLTHPGGLFNPISPTSSPPIIKPTTFLGNISGNYHLTSWNQTSGTISYPVGAKAGTLVISSSGDADWELVLLDLALGSKPQPSPEPRIKCKGKARISSQQMEGIPGSANEEVNWDKNLDSNKDWIFPALCGWSSDGKFFPFTLLIENGILEMKNSRGTYTWSK